MPKNWRQEAMMHERGYISVAEAAKAIGVDQETIRKAVKRGDVEETKIGAMCFVTVNSVVQNYGNNDPKNMGQIQKLMQDRLQGSIVLSGDKLVFVPNEEMEISEGIEPDDK